ncbi:DNA modification methylase [Paenibacillus turicensis]|uniref:Methyltransferase n=1 Tax=Paenibacillus turicensis TaxID=160487 RepID=A0ABS4FUR6_9BACL|nr:site-specific DNA-methyltransferase [Paenibacillus turicensis]MBP1906322.1 DNA modification methylase [Paenibacillus turicensis]
MKKQIEGIQLNRVYQRDCIEGMKLLPSESIDLIVADPPYNTGIKGTKINMKETYGFNYFKEAWDKIDNFHDFNQAWIAECYRVLKPDGSILAYGTHHNLFTVGHLIEQAGFTIRAKYEWKKKNPPPNFSGSGPHFASESIIWASKGKRRTYNLDYAKRINDNKNIKSVFETTLTPRDEKKHGKFPCQKPLEISIKLINLHSHPDQIVLIPFCGSGSECVAAQMTGRNFITFERESDYIELANMRLENTDELKDKLSHLI